jgi:hypothetical protein
MHALKGLEGQSLAEVFAQNQSVLGSRAVAASPEGRNRVEAHVKVPSEWFDLVPANEGEDAEVLKELADEGSVSANSRLGSRIVLSKELDGMSVSVGPTFPWRTL